MARPPATYDLLLLLDPQADEAVRAKILADARAAIAAKGEVVRDDDWGDRALVYPIERKTDANYHLLQFHASTSELLGELDRTLRITDGIMRFRIVKLKPGTPEAPEMRRGASAAHHRHGHGETPPASPPPARSPAGAAASEPA